MPQNYKGVYPNWLSDPAIIDQVLHDIVAAGGKLPYSYIVSKSENNDSYERMQQIIFQMRREKLIIGPLSDEGFIEIDIEGSRASILGYEKYRKLKLWDPLRRMNRFFLFVATILILGLCGFGLYLILHKLRVI